MMTKDIGDAMKADFDQLFEKWKQMIFELGYKTAKSEIVHCKDCEYWPYKLLPYSENTTADTTHPHCFDFKSNGYCSLGRKEIKKSIDYDWILLCNINCCPD